MFLAKKRSMWILNYDYIINIKNLIVCAGVNKHILVKFTELFISSIIRINVRFLIHE